MGSRLNSALSFSDVDVGDVFQFINHIIAERRRNTKGRSGVVVVSFSHVARSLLIGI